MQLQSTLLLLLPFFLCCHASKGNQLQNEDPIKSSQFDGLKKRSGSRTRATIPPDPSCVGLKIPTADDPEEEGDYVDPNNYKRMSLAGRIDLEPRAGRPGPNRFGNCAVPNGVKITFPGSPTVQAIRNIEGSNKPADQQVLAGVARYYDRNETCGITNFTKLADIKDPPGTKPADEKANKYSMDHAWELKLLLEFFKTFMPPHNVFWDCNNFNEVFFPAGSVTGKNVMQTLYNLVPTNSDASGNKQIEFVIMLKDLNNKKGVIFKPDEFTNQFWLKKNLPEGNLEAMIVVLQDVSIAMGLCSDPDVVKLFDKTNFRIYNAFQGIDEMISKKDIKLKDPTFSFAAEYEKFMSDFLRQQEMTTWTFIQKLMDDTQAAIDKILNADTSKKDYQAILDNIKNSDFGKEEHYSFKFATELTNAGGDPIVFT